MIIWPHLREPGTRSLAVSPGRRGTEFGNQTPVSALGFVGNSSPVMGMLCKLIHFTLTATLQMVTIFILQVKKLRRGISLTVQWLRLHVSNAGGSGSIPSQGTKIRHAVQCGQKVKRRKEKLRLKEMICPRPHYSIVREQVLRHFYLCSSIKPASLFELSKDGESVNSSSQMELIHIQGIVFFFFSKASDFTCSQSPPGLPWRLSCKESTCQCRRCELDP